MQISRVRYYESRDYGIGHLAIHNLPPGGTTGSTMKGNWTLPERIYQKLELRGNLIAVEAPLSLLSLVAMFTTAAVAEHPPVGFSRHRYDFRMLELIRQ